MNVPDGEPTNFGGTAPSGGPESGEPSDFGSGSWPYNEDGSPPMGEPADFSQNSWPNGS